MSHLRQPGRQSRRALLKAIEFSSGREAAEHAVASGGRQRAVLLEGKRLVIARSDADRLEVARVPFAYLGVHKGRVMTVPVND